MRALARLRAVRYPVLPMTNAVCVTLRCNTMPSEHERIPVIKDAALGAAMEQVAALVDPATKTATWCASLSCGEPRR